VKAVPVMHPGALARFRFLDVLARQDFEKRAVRIIELPIGAHFETQDGRHQTIHAHRAAEGYAEPYVIGDSVAFPGARVTYYPDALVIPLKELDR